MQANGDSWKSLLERDYHGRVLSSMSNISKVLENDPGMSGVYYNELSGNIDKSGALPWRKDERGWCNSDFSCFQLYLEQNYQIYAPSKCRDGLDAFLFSRRRKNPIKEYLECIEWDGKERVETALIDYLGAEDNTYTKTVTKKTLIAAIARVYEPGIKFDHVLVLCGPQGIGKSTFFSLLGKKWYSDSMTIADMRDKTASEKLQGVWIMEIGELAGLRKVDVETVKAFISRQTDIYRPAYGVYADTHPRNGIIVGTTNAKDGFLRDISGNRRFWPVSVNRKPDEEWKLHKMNVDQMWAEALWRYHHGESIFLDTDEEKIAGIHQRKAMESDPRSGLVEEYLKNEQDRMICLMEIWCKCLGKKRQDMKKKDAYEILAILEKIGGWEAYKGNPSGKMRTEEFGVQKVFVYSK